MCRLREKDLNDLEIHLVQYKKQRLKNKKEGGVRGGSNVIY